MLQLMRSTKTPVSSATEILNRNWRTIRFMVAKRSFESQLEGIPRAAASHDSVIKICRAPSG